MTELEKLKIIYKKSKKIKEGFENLRDRLSKNKKKFGIPSIWDAQIKASSATIEISERAIDLLKKKIEKLNSEV